MAKTLLTDLYLRSLKPSDRKSQIIWDAALNSFGVRISSTGKRAFIVLKRFRGKLVYATLGYYPVMGLADARQRAQAALRQISEGTTPEIVSMRQRPRERSADAFSAIAEDFLRLSLGRLKSGELTARFIDNTLVAAWHDRPIDSIRRRDIIALAKSVRETRGDYAGRHVISAASRLFRWAVAQDLLETSPAWGIKVPDIAGRLEPRSRVLNDVELRLIWHAVSELEYPWQPLLKLLTLTGQRRSEIAEMRWSEIEGNVLVVPASRMKNRASHSVPLGPEAMRIVNGVPRFVRGDYVFTATGGASPVKNLSRVKKVIDHATGVRDWRLHDIRRTVRTALSSLGILPVVAELVIGHAQQGVNRVYDLHRFDAEKRQAIEAWEKKLLDLVA
jgi:integrase